MKYDRPLNTKKDLYFIKLGRICHFGAFHGVLNNFQEFVGHEL